jgi:hypothetical protein
MAMSNYGRFEGYKPAERGNGSDHRAEVSNRLAQEAPMDRQQTYAQRYDLGNNGNLGLPQLEITNHGGQRQNHYAGQGSFGSWKNGAMALPQRENHSYADNQVHTNRSTQHGGFGSWRTGGMALPDASRQSLGYTWHRTQSTNLHFNAYSRQPQDH